MSALDTKPGSIIGGRYRVVNQLGCGGMGMVFRCRDLTLDDDVALKVVLPHLVADQASFKRFRNEVLVARTLTHHNIVRIHDITPAEDGYYCISMEYVDGVSLRDIIHGIPGYESETKVSLSFKQKLSIFHQVLCGVSYAHGKGVIHRDLKPANVLISSEGEVKIVDFGTARLMGSDSNLTMTGQMVGTPDYMAPEQIRGEDLTESCDIYALGIVGYELMTSQKPFVAETPVAVAFKHLSESLPALRKVAPSVPAWFERMVSRAADKDKDKRYGSVSEMLSELQAHSNEMVNISGVDDAETTIINAKTSKRISELKQAGATLKDATGSFTGLELNHGRMEGFAAATRTSTPKQAETWSWGQEVKAKEDDQTDTVDYSLEQERTSFSYTRVIVGLIVLCLVGYMIKIKMQGHEPNDTPTKLAQVVATPSVVVTKDVSSLKTSPTAKATQIVSKIVVEKPDQKKSESPGVPIERAPQDKKPEGPVQAVVPNTVSEAQSDGGLAKVQPNQEATQSEPDLQSAKLEDTEQAPAVKSPVQAPAQPTVAPTAVPVPTATPAPTPTVAKPAFQLSQERLLASGGFVQENGKIERAITEADLKTAHWSVGLKGLSVPASGDVIESVKNQLSASLVNEGAVRSVTRLAIESIEQGPDNNSLLIQGSFPAINQKVVRPGEYKLSLVAGAETIAAPKVTIKESPVAKELEVPEAPVRPQPVLEEESADVVQKEERKVPWSVPTLAPSPEEPKQDYRPSLDIYTNQGSPITAEDVPPADPFAGVPAESYRGMLISSDGKKQRAASFDLKFAGSDIGGKAQISGVGEMKIKGRVFERGFQLDLSNAQQGIRLTGSRRDGTMRGRFSSTTLGESGSWEVTR